MRQFQQKFKRTLSPFCLMFFLCLVFMCFPSNHTWVVCMCQTWEKIKDVCRYASNSDWLLLSCNCQHVTVCVCLTSVTSGFMLGLIGHKLLFFLGQEKRDLTLLRVRNNPSESICLLSNVLAKMLMKCGIASLSVLLYKVKLLLNHGVNIGLTKAELHPRQLGC